MRAEPMDRNLSAERIFHTARGKTADSERAAYLEGACGGNVALRNKVDALLRADAQANTFLKERSTGALDPAATAEFHSGIRVDYLLPSTDLEVTGGGVFWPAPEEDPEGHAWAEAASDHRLVWLDLIWRRDGAEPAETP